MNDMLKLKIPFTDANGKDGIITYGMRPMPPMKGSAFGLRVVKILGGLIANPESLSTLKGLAAKAKGETVSIDGEQTMTLMMTLMKLVGSIDPAEVDALMKDAVSYEVYADDLRLSDEMNFNIHFQKYPGHLYPVCFWAAWSHVKPFFTGLGAGLTALMPSSEKAKKVDLQ